MLGNVDTSATQDIVVMHHNVRLALLRMLLRICMVWRPAHQWLPYDVGSGDNDGDGGDGHEKQRENELNKTTSVPNPTLSNAQPVLLCLPKQPRQYQATISNNEHNKLCYPISKTPQPLPVFFCACNTQHSARKIVFGYRLQIK